MTQTKRNSPSPVATTLAERGPIQQKSSWGDMAKAVQQHLGAETHVPAAPAQLRTTSLLEDSVRSILSENGQPEEFERFKAFVDGLPPQIWLHGLPGWSIPEQPGTTEEVMEAIMSVRKTLEPRMNDPRISTEQRLPLWIRAVGNSLSDLLRTKDRQDWKSCYSIVMEMPTEIRYFPVLGNTASLPDGGKVDADPTGPFRNAFADAGMEALVRLDAMPSKPISAVVVFAAWIGGEIAVTASDRFEFDGSIPMGQAPSDMVAP